MKRLSLLLLIVGLIFFCTQSTSAQENKKKKEAKLKILVNKDGKTVKFDTTLHDFKDHKELIKIMESKNLPDSLIEVFEGEDFLWISNDKESHGKHKVIIKEFLDSDSDHHSDIRKRISKHIKVISEDDENIIITEGDGEHKTIKIEIIDEDGKIHKKHSKGKKVYIIKEGIDMDISEDGDVKIIKIDCHSDHDEDIDIEVEVTDDGKTVKKIKKKKKAKKGQRNKAEKK
ncbi:hypothetical protein L3073_13920 [Ancylomarina sp. DW003]|nr:hypothetical protein [Ancylomarina sp. DW003]MDE5423312.1 hypothetical protein [Ancylomarina sp. DW003]